MDQPEPKDRSPEDAEMLPPPRDALDSALRAWHAGEGSNAVSEAGHSRLMRAILDEDAQHDRGVYAPISIEPARKVSWTMRHRAVLAGSLVAATLVMATTLFVYRAGRPAGDQSGAGTTETAGLAADTRREREFEAANELELAKGDLADVRLDMSVSGTSVAAARSAPAAGMAHGSAQPIVSAESQHKNTRALVVLDEPLQKRFIVQMNQQRPGESKDKKQNASNAQVPVRVRLSTYSEHVAAELRKHGLQNFRPLQTDNLLGEAELDEEQLLNVVELYVVQRIEELPAQTAPAPAPATAPTTAPAAPAQPAKPKGGG